MLCKDLERLNEGLKDNSLTLESCQTRHKESLLNMQVKKVKMLLLRGKKELSEEDDKLKKQLKRQEALLVVK